MQLIPVAFAIAIIQLGSVSACQPPIAVLDALATTTRVGSGTQESCTEAALRAAVNSGAFVKFDCGVRPTTIAISDTIVIDADKDTVIDGENRITLDGRGAARILSLSSPGYRSNRHGLTLQRIRLVNGRADGVGYVRADSRQPHCASGYSAGNGGAVDVRNARLDVVDVDFEGNAAASPGPDVGGGAIHVTGSLGLRVVASRFVGNTGSNGGAIALLQSDASIWNSRFENNSATGTGRNYAGTEVAGCPGVGHPGQGGSGGNGGAVVVDGSDDGDLIVCGSAFVGNRANELAGALFRTSNVSARRTLVEQTSFADNRAAQAGALFIMNSSPLDVVRSNFTDNSAEAGGAVQFAASRFRIENSIFAGNRATRGPGGALMLSGNDPASEIAGVTFASNTAAAAGSDRSGESIFGDTRVSIRASMRCDTVRSPMEAALSQPVTSERSGKCTVKPIERLDHP